MTEPKYTAAEYQAIISKAKPYLFELDRQVLELGYGALDVRLDVRNGEVTKLTTIYNKTWLLDLSKNKV
jgi:hypothetical protein